MREPAGFRAFRSQAPRCAGRSRRRAAATSHPRVVPLLPAGILGLSLDQDLGEIQQEIHQMVLSQPLTR